jgi:hypothetical protein
VYKNYDPRAKVIKDIAYKVFEVTGKNHLIDIALELERIALEDDFFVERKLYPNVDFYSGLILRAMGLPLNMFTVVFAMARTVGWISHWLEMQIDPEARIGRPQQIYTGEKHREGSIVVVAAIVALSHGRAAEFAAPDDESVFEQVAVLEVLDQSGDGLVGVLAVFRQRFVEAAVLVPSFMEKLNEADVALNESAGY